MNKNNEKKIKELIEISIKNADSMAHAARIIDLNYKTFRKYAIKFGLFSPNPSGKGMSKPKIKTEDVLNNKVYMKSSQLKKRLIKEGYLKYNCKICKINKWMEKEIVLELDHINGNSRDNRIHNLRILCPNCHSQTENFRGRNIKNKKTAKKLKDIDIKNSFYISENLNQLCLNLKIKSTKNNYENLKKRLKMLNLDFDKNRTKNENEILKLKNKLNIVFKKNNNTSTIKKENYCIDCKIKILPRSKRCYKCDRINKRKIKRPSYQELLKELKESNYSVVGKKYGVSDNAIRKWIKYYKKTIN